MYGVVPFVLLAGRVLPDNEFGFSEVRAGVHIFHKYNYLFIFSTLDPDRYACFCAPSEFACVLLLWRLGVSDHGVRRATLTSSFSWFCFLHHAVRRCVMRQHMVLLEYPVKYPSSSLRYWGSTLDTMSSTRIFMTARLVHHSVQSVSWSALRASYSKLEVSSLVAALILSSLRRALTVMVPLVYVEGA